MNAAMGTYFCYFSCWHLGDNFMSSFCSSSEPQYKHLYRSLLWVKLNLLSDCRLGLFRMNSSGHWEQYFIHKVLFLCREYTRKYELKERFSIWNFGSKCLSLKIILSSQCSVFVHSIKNMLAIYQLMLASLHLKKKNPI